MIVMVLVVGGFSWWSFWQQSEGFGEFDRIVGNTTMALQIDRDIVSVRRNFAAYIQDGKADRMHRVDELLAGLDRSLASLTASTHNPDRQQLIERLGTLVAGLRNQMNIASEKRQLRDSQLADIRPLGKQLREAIHSTKSGDALLAMDALMRTRLAIMRLVDDPTEEARKEADNDFREMEDALGKLTLPDDRARDLKTTLRAFRATFESSAETALSLDRLVDDSIEHLVQEAATTSAKLRALQTTRLDTLRDSFHKQIDSTLAVIAAMSLLALLLAVTIASVVARMVMKPIDEMARAAAVAVEIGEIIGLASEGDFRNRVVVEHREGFVRVIGEHVNSLFNSVSSALLSIRRAVTVMSGSATTTAGAVTEVSAGADAQAAALQQVRDALRMSAEAITYATASAQDAGVSSERATRLVSSSTAVISRLVATIEAIAVNSHKVAEITATIGEIAQRTNILATTTGIEAARNVGESNVFGVIARQVDALSESCGKAAREIAHAIDAAARDTQTGIAIAAEATSVINQILERVAETDEKLRSICEAMVTQQASSTEISATVDSLTTIAEQNVVASRDISKTLEQLRLLGIETQESVARFHIEE